MFFKKYRDSPRAGMMLTPSKKPSVRSQSSGKASTSFYVPSPYLLENAAHIEIKRIINDGVYKRGSSAYFTADYQFMHQSDCGAGYVQESKIISWICKCKALNHVEKQET